MEWKEDKLGNVLEVKYGKDHKKLPAGNIPVYGSGGLMRYVDKKLFDGPSILIPRKGTLNNILFVDKAFWTVDTMFWTIINEEIVDPKYLFYSICKKDFASMNVGSAVPSMTVPILNDIDIKYPKEKEDQHRIASILSSLDRKIELNNKINAQLEEMAQAIFKSWFVDFEPFKDGKFVESELGLIPEGWRVGTLGEVCDIVGGSTPSKAKPEYYTENGISWLTPKDLSTQKSKFTAKGEIDITEEGYNSTSTKLMSRGSVLFSSRAPIGYITIAKNEICTNQGFKSAIPKKAGTAFLYCYLKNKTSEIENKSTGSTFKEASGSLIKSLNVFIPNQEIFDRFEKELSPIFNKQEIIEDENLHLAQLRDTLLPKLMNGEIEI